MQKHSSTEANHAFPPLNKRNTSSKDRYAQWYTTQYHVPHFFGTTQQNTCCGTIKSHLYVNLIYTRSSA